MILSDIHRVYFIGIGGIGMSALARYFLSEGKAVAGYDRLSTPLSDQLVREGMNIHFSDDISLIPEEYRNRQNTLVVYTPAIPESHSEYLYFRHKGFEIMKRSQVLGRIMENHKSIAVAGTHGKTTISSMIAHIFHSSGTGCKAFLGGIAKNFGSNLVIGKKSDFYIAEADEFDRSFLQLFPDYAVVSAVDDDHMDIYRNRKYLLESFSKFIGQIKPGGTLILKKGVQLDLPEGVKTYLYSLEDPCDYFAFDIKKSGFSYQFSLHTPSADIHGFETSVWGKLNVENAVAAIAVALQAGIDVEAIRLAVKTFRGVIRRFDIRINDGRRLFIDDYAHHPEELKAFIKSVKEMVPGKRITGVFQPHLFSRTKDHADGFAESLSLLDDVILLDIYPAREEPVPGVSSELIFRNLHNPGKKILTSKGFLLKLIEDMRPEVLLFMGAGDIDQLVEPAKKLLEGMST